MDLLEKYIVELLHISEVEKNNLIDINCKRNTTIKLKSEFKDTYEDVLEVIKKRIGKPGNTFLKNSSRSDVDQHIGIDSTYFDWNFLSGIKDKDYLDSYLDNVYKNMSTKGFNPLFLSIGSLRWKVAYKDENKEIETPLIIFPIKLVRQGQASPISIEFVEDDIYFNPCLYYKLLEQIPVEVVDNMPRIGNDDSNSLTNHIDLKDLNVEYFDKIEKYVKDNKKTEETVFEILKDRVYISEYNHEDICMYYDLRNHYDKVVNSPIVSKLFLKNPIQLETNENVGSLDLILPYDSFQEEILLEVLKGKSMIIKGPPGTGKTLTIANMISSLISHGKNVLFSSKKNSAMTEVYAKLPEQIRNFSLLLEAETEAQAASISPSKVKKELKKLYEIKKDYKNHNVNQDINIKENSYSRILDLITKYYKFVNDKDLVEASYYDKLLEYYKYDKNLELLEIIDPQIALDLSKQDYDYIVNNLTSINSLLELLTHKFKHSIRLCPYFNIKEEVDKENIYQQFSKTADIFKELYDLIDKSSISFDNLTIMSLVWFLENEINKEQIEQILKIDNLKDYKKKIYDKLLPYLKLKEKDIEFLDIDHDKLLEICSLLNNLNLINDLNNKDLDHLYNNISSFINDNDNYLSAQDIEILAKDIDYITSLEEKIGKHENDFHKVFKKQLDENSLKEILDSYDVCQKNIDKDLNFFSFKAKNTFKKLKEYSYLNDVTFKELAKAVIDFKNMVDCQNNINKTKSNMARVVQKEVDEQLYLSIKILVRYQNNLKEVIKLVKDNYDNIKQIASLLKKDYYTIKQLNEYTNDLLTIDEFNSLIDSIAKDIEITNKEIFAKNLIGIIELESNDVDRINDLVIFVKENKDKISSLIKSSTDILQNLKDSFDYNYYVSSDYEISFNNIKYFIEEVKNRELLASYDKFVSICTDLKLNELINLRSIIYKYIDNLDYYIDNKNEFLNILMKSLCYGLVNAKIKKHLSEISQISLGLEENTNELASLTEEILHYNILKSEDKLMSFINDKDEIYRALYSEKTDKNLRLLFKNEPQLILKLKRNFILSPSTASLLFSKDEYSNFDTLIIDEASQMLPYEMLPLLFRSKQVIIVGDEWQMPPISHFKVKTDNKDEEDEILSKDESALALALKTKLLKIYELCCHYRSKTESLIKFSQKQYYPFMQTFPAPIPKREDIGIEDIYIENGSCSDGKNLLEAQKVVEIIKDHFEKYYDSESNSIKVTLGVVAFGEKQRDLILDLINKDAKLAMEIRKLTNILAVPEKVFFVKTIEKVQGQEADHLILSLTYGRKQEGNVSQSFGELNRECGDCIFNVAVTRSKSKIYVIHSILPEDITNKNIDFIAKYLFIARELSSYGKEQFINQMPNSFYLDVGNYLESIGISKDRIVYNYGVTEGSIRIPIAILSQDYSKAIGGLWLEKDNLGKKYVDINSRYYTILKQNGWKFKNIYIHNWFYNNEFEKKKIKEFVDKL